MNRFEALLAAVILYVASSREDEDATMYQETWEKIANALKIPVRTKAMSAMDSNAGGALIQPPEFPLKKRKSPLS